MVYVCGMHVHVCMSGVFVYVYMHTSLPATCLLGPQSLLSHSFPALTTLKINPSKMHKTKSVCLYLPFSPALSVTECKLNIQKKKSQARANLSRQH